MHFQFTNFAFLFDIRRECLRVWVYVRILATCYCCCQSSLCIPKESIWRKGMREEKKNESDLHRFQLFLSLFFLSYSVLFTFLPFHILAVIRFHKCTLSTSRAKRQCNFIANICYPFWKEWIKKISSNSDSTEIGHEFLPNVI